MFLSDGALVLQKRCPRLGGFGLVQIVVQIEWNMQLQRINDEI
jgi:hypothetical protein